MTCPVHFLGQQAVSFEELVWWRDHAEELHICHNCLYYIDKEIETRWKLQRDTQEKAAADLTGNRVSGVWMEERGEKDKKG
jgi:hypothetical protein